MNTCIEDVRVHNDYAIRCSIVSKPVNVVEYVRAVSSVIGASHILAVFEERDSVKIFLNEKRFVDTLMKSCLHVMGHHISVDYVSPPGTKLVLTDVDPIISNYDVMRLLSVYGTVVSPVIRPPVSDDTDLCHIGYGVRYVYMDLLTENVPEKIEFKYGEHMFSFKIHVETADIVMLANIKADPYSNNFLENENSDSSILSEDVSSPPVVVSVQSVHSNEVECTTPKLPISEADKNQGSNKKKQRGRPPSSVKRMRISKTMTATTKAARKIRRNVKHKWIRKRNRKGKAGSITLVTRTARNPSNSSSSCVSTMPDPSVSLGQTEEEHDTNEVLDKERLLEFLNEVKNNRAPLELAKKYLGDDCDSISKLVEQLDAFRKHQLETSLKIRVWRLMKSLKDSLNNSNQSISADMTE